MLSSSIVKELSRVAASVPLSHQTGRINDAPSVLERRLTGSPGIELAGPRTFPDRFKEKGWST
jgi:hypothetical protein